MMPSLHVAIGVLAPDVVAFQFAQQGKSDILRLARLTHQRHVSLVGGTAAFAMVAVAASGHDIIPSRLPAARARHDMIDRELAAAGLGAAVLACLAIAR